MNDKTFGSFIFEDIGNGCLAGKWHANTEEKAYPEAAKLISCKGDLPFEGTYKTTWVQQNDKIESTELIISRLSGEIYTVIWRRGNNTEYHGQAMIYKGMLVGHYYE